MRRLFSALAIVLLGVGLSRPATAASVAPIPVPPGAQSAATVAARFGVDPSTWSEIRFTDPTNQSLATGTHTKSAGGNTITITVTPGGTVDFISLKPIEAVYVNKGNGPTSANAIYRYVPPVLRDTDLGLRPVTLSGVDHVVLWWSTATTQTTTTSTTAAPPPTSPPTTSPPPEVRAVSISRSPTRVGQPATTLPTSSSSVGQPATTVVPILPATGSSGSGTVIAGSALVLAGMLVLFAHRTVPRSR
jgi:hypothetical protein